MRSIAVRKPNEVKLVDIEMPKCGPYDALIKTEISLICNGTDRRLMQGIYRDLDDTSYPFLLGHENVGIVTEVGAKTTSYKPGDRVIVGFHLNPEAPYKKSLYGGLSDYVLAKDIQAMTKDRLADPTDGWGELAEVTHIVPPDISAEQAGVLITWREVYSAFTDFSLKAGDKILIFGVGPVGISFANFARLLGFSFIACVAPKSPKHDVAKRLGADVTYTPDEDYVEKFIKDAGGKADATIDAVGVPDITKNALPALKEGGTMGVYGVIDTPSITLPLHHPVPSNFHFVMHHFPTREYERAATEPLCQWIREGKINSDDYITGRFSIDDYEKALAAHNDKSSIKTVLTFQ